MSLAQCLLLTWLPCIAAAPHEPPAASQNYAATPTVTAAAPATPSAVSDSAAAAPATVIRAVATGVRHERGKVRMSLYAQADGFPDQPEHCLQWQQVLVAGDSAVVVFAPAPSGHYAVAAFHDEDGDGALRRDRLGRPREGWGVSRNANARFGPPHFESSAFGAAGDTVNVRMRMRY